MTHRNKFVATAYDFFSSKEYDQRRFQSPQGLIFHALEWEQFDWVLKKLPPSAKVLEVGCGSGRFVKLVGEMGYPIWGVEPSHTMLEISADKCRNLKNVTLSLGEGAKLDFPDSSFDLVYLPEELETTKDQLERDDMNQMFYHSRRIDLKKEVLEQLNLTFPVKPLCSKDCQGICPVCGKIIQDGECSCVITESDPRLEKLKTFIRDKR